MESCEVAHTVLIIAISAMVLVSLHPFAFRKIALLAAAILGFSSVVCFADSLFMTRQYEPAEHQARSGGAGGRSQSATTATRIPLPQGSSKIESGQAGLPPGFLEVKNFVNT